MEVAAKVDTLPDGPGGLGEVRHQRPGAQGVSAIGDAVLGDVYRHAVAFREVHQEIADALRINLHGVVGYFAARPGEGPREEILRRGWAERDHVPAVVVEADVVERSGSLGDAPAEARREAGATLRADS